MNNRPPMMMRLTPVLLGVLLAVLSRASAHVPKSSAAPEPVQRSQDLAASRLWTKSADRLPELETVDQRASYGIGYGTASTLLREGVIDVDPDAFMAGLLDALSATETQVAESSLRAAFEELDQRVEQRAARLLQGNLAEAMAFLERNARREAVIVTDSGLQYEILTASAQAYAAKPTITDTVLVHYHGTLIDGTVFDSSVVRNSPLSIPLAGVIPGWIEVLKDASGRQVEGYCRHSHMEMPAGWSLRFRAAV